MSDNKTTESVKQQLPLANLATALSKAQAMMCGAKKAKDNIFFKSKYSDLSSVFDAIKEPFAKNGLSVTQTMDLLESGIQILRTRLFHSSGEYIDSKMILPVELNPQKLGSLITYLRRYSLMAIAGVASEDDDGNDAVGRKDLTPPMPPTPPQQAPVQAQESQITQTQIKYLESLMAGNDRVRKFMLDCCNQNLGTISSSRYAGALKLIESEIKKDLESSSV